MRGHTITRRIISVLCITGFASASVYAASTSDLKHENKVSSQSPQTHITSSHAKSATATTGSYVAADYIGTLSDGTVFDTSLKAVAQKAGIYSVQKNYRPLHTVIGQRSLIAGFERALIGMKKNEKKTITVAPRDAYGEVDQSKIAIINRSYFDESMVTPVVGQTYGLMGEAMKLTSLSGDLATLDRNHPLAGKTLTFVIQIKDIARLAPVPGNATSFAQGVMSSHQLRSLQKKKHGTETTIAKPLFTMIEYSDLECPYCVRQYKDGIIASILKDFPGKIQYTYTPVVGNNHPNSAYKASAVICAGNVGGASAFRKTYQGILGTSTPNIIITTGAVLAIVQETNIDMQKRASCMTPEATTRDTDTKSTTDDKNDKKKEENKKNTGDDDSHKQTPHSAPASATAKKVYERNGNEFTQRSNTQATPSTLIVNNKTRQRILVAGAYGLDVFKGILEMRTK